MLPSATSFPSEPTCQTMIWLFDEALSSATTTYTVEPPSEAIAGTGESTSVLSVERSGCCSVPNTCTPVWAPVGQLVVPFAGLGMVQTREYQLPERGAAFVPSTMCVALTPSFGRSSNAVPVSIFIWHQPCSRSVGSVPFDQP